MAGQRVEGQLTMFDSVTKKPAHTYTGRCVHDVCGMQTVYMHLQSAQQDGKLNMTQLCWLCAS